MTTTQLQDAEYDPLVQLGFGPQSLLSIFFFCTELKLLPNFLGSC